MEFLHMRLSLYLKVPSFGQAPSLFSIGSLPFLLATTPGLKACLCKKQFYAAA
jgi:hypothetical protein